MNGRLYISDSAKNSIKEELKKAATAAVEKGSAKIDNPKVATIVSSTAKTVLESAVDKAVDTAIEKNNKDLPEDTATINSVKTATELENQKVEIENHPTLTKILNFPVSKIFTSTSFFVIIYLLAWSANSYFGLKFDLNDLLYLYSIVIGKNVVTYGIDSAVNSKRGNMPDANKK